MLIYHCSHFVGQELYLVGSMSQNNNAYLLVWRGARDEQGPHREGVQGGGQHGPLSSLCELNPVQIKSAHEVTLLRGDFPDPLLILILYLILFLVA